jgi:YspA, cpYpsA-related SLOG family
MRILICGSRDYNNPSKVLEILRRYVDQNPVIVHGDAPGADSCGKLAAEILELEVEPHPADWKKHGKAAGPIRNQEMATTGIDLGLAFWDGKSKGTRDMMNRLHKLGVEVKVYR